MAAFVSGVGGAAMIVFGSAVVPVDSIVGAVCDVAGIASVMVCFGLMDGA